MPNAIVILTGAGVSAESGVDTFRDTGGIWSRYNLEEVATPEGFSANPTLVHEFYNGRRSQLSQVEPNATHFALARLEREHEGEVLLVTQNIDDLHERAGSKNLIHMHGEIAKALCAKCDARCEWREPLSAKVPCPSCGEAGGMRPDVVWFGEMPYQMERIYEALGQCGVFISIGTSGSVYPAAQFVQEAARAGAHTVELNLEPSENRLDFDEAIHGPASRVVPEYVELILKGDISA
ncbi:NAD-dependent deacylase [Chelativorans sp. YIM 93263]|uniref:NAD-dependent deacylase n=1 Tax=Chelativorans sp. YIM 93263 TaxID=2906648 RepID=UPI00237868F6|nr:NAD-dependent deacylase [Chelativorans sp. YIM 93263]